MWSRFKSSFIADINIMWENKALFARILAPFVLLIILMFGFPILSGYVFSKTGFQLNNYYSIVAITFVSIISTLPGIVYAFILLSEKDLHIEYAEEVSLAGRCKILFMRMIIPTFISFVFVVTTIILAKPVPTEGWLRTLFAAFLFSIQSPFVFMFISSLAQNKNAGLVLSRFYWIFLIAVPLGLLLHHPWNYFTFFSPLYWVAWAWIVPSQVESMIYGSIAVVLTSGAIVIFSRNLLRKNTI
jgi:hypothetical protein